MRYLCVVLILLLFGLSSAIGTPVLTKEDSLKVDTKTGNLSTKQVGPALTLAEMQKYKATTLATRSVFSAMKSKVVSGITTESNKKPMTLDEWHKIKSKAINSISITSSKSGGVLSPVDANKIDKEKLLGNKPLISLTSPESTNKPPKKETAKEKPKTLEEWHNLKKKMLGNVSIVTGNTPVSVPKSTDKGKQMQTITVNGKKVEINPSGQVAETNKKVLDSVSIVSGNSPASVPKSPDKSKQTITVNGKTYDVQTLIEEQKTKKNLLGKDNAAEKTSVLTPISPEQLREIKQKLINKLAPNSPARKALEEGKDNKAPSPALESGKQAESHTAEEWREIKKNMLGKDFDAQKKAVTTPISPKEQSEIEKNLINKLDPNSPARKALEQGKNNKTPNPEFNNGKQAESRTLDEWHAIKKSRLGKNFDAQKKSVTSSISPREQSEIEKQLINKLDANNPLRKAMEQGNNKATTPDLGTTKSKSGTTIHIDASKQGKARTTEEWQKIREAERKKDSKGANKSMDPVLPKDAPKPTIQNDNVGSENSKVGPDKNVQGTYINITFPNGGQLFRPSTYYNITWSTSYYNSYAYYVAIWWYNPYYGYYGGWGYYRGSNMGASIPTPPSGIVSSSYEPYWRLYVQNYSSGYSYYGNDLSDNYLTISSNPAWRVIWPNGGETLYNGTTYTFQWTGPTQSQVPYVYVYYSTNSGSTYNSLGSKSNTGSMSISFGGFNYTTMRWKIVSYYDSYEDVCNSNFTITSAPSITITYPYNGLIFYPGETRRVTWSWTGSIPYVYLYYYYSGYGWVSVNSYLSNVGYYDWVIPNTPSTQCQFFVGGYYGEAYDYSDGYYQITNKWQVTYPNGGQTWYNGTTYQMTWTGPSQSQVPYCYVYYSINGGSSWSVITTSAPNTGYYNWTPSGISSTTCRMRIENQANYDGDMSDSNFTITSSYSITITYPYNGLIFYPGETRRVTWNWTGNIPTVYLYYYYAEYGWTYITGGLSNVGYYDWVIPNTPSTQCQFFVGGDRGEAYDYSDGYYQITKKWQVTYPNGGQTWYNGSTYQMSWTGPSQSQVPYCWVYYSTNSGSNWTVITTSAPNIGYYNWTPSGINSTACRMKIENSANYDNDISDANFTITYAPSITITYPNSGPIFYPGETRRVTWTWTGSIPYVYLYYYTAELGWTQVNGYLANVGYYDWVIPNTPSTQCQFFVGGYYGEAYDFSDGYYQITKKWLIVVPNGGEHWYNGGVGGTMTWTGPTQSQVPLVNLSFSTDSGATWNGGTFYNFANDGSQSFGFGGWNCTTVRMRVQDSGNTNNWDGSDADFSITDYPGITVTYPNGGESLYPGNTCNIRWSYTSPLLPKVNIYYTTNGGSSWTTIVSNLTNTGSYNWTVPNSPSTNCYVKVESYSDASIYDTSNSAFTITALWRVTYPNGGETWYNGTAYYITWTGPTQAQVPNIYLSLSTNSGSTWCATIGPYANVSGAYGWSFGGFNYTTCRIKIYDASNSSNYDISDANFTIKDRPSITITYPYNGLIFYPGETRRVTWNYTGTVPLIDFWYYTASLGWTCLATNVTNVGYIDWVIPNTPSTQCQVFVGSPSRDAYDYSDGYFQITNRWQVTYPNGGETWYNGTTYTMTWTGPTQAQVPYCWVYVSTTSGSSWSVITTSAPNTGSYAWTPTGYNATTCRMRIENAANIDGDMSDANFRITYIPLRVTAPNGGEVYHGGYSYNITWVGGSLTCTLVNLYYSTDGGSSWVAIVTGTANDGSQAWTVPNIPSTTCRVRVQNYYSSSEYDISDANFTIESFRVTYPNGGQTLYPGSTCSITWTYTGSIPYVSLYYSTNGGSTWLTIATYVSNTSSYNWTVPNTPSSTCRVKVQNYSYSSEYDQSDANFSIYAPWQVTYPNGGQVFYEGDTFTMTWTGPTQAQIPYVWIYFSTNSGSSWTVIGTNISNSGSANIYCSPGVLSENCRMRVEAYNSSYGDNSDANFAIRSRPWQVTYPNGGQVFYEGDTFTMTWNGPSQTYIPYVWIYFSTNSGSSYYLIGYNVPNTHSANIYCDYDVVSENCRVRVEAYNSSNGDNSDADFAIRYSRNWHVNWPNGGETLYAGYQYNMRWTGPSQSEVPYVDLYLSKDYGSHWTYMSTYPGARNTHSFYYVPAGATSYQCLFKVENPSNNDGDVSDGVFTIIGSVSQGRENAVNIAKTMTTMKFTVGPSPFRGNLRLQLPNSGSIYSLTGKLIRKLNKGEHNLDTSKWSPGIYIIQCGTELKRIVKTN